MWSRQLKQKLHCKSVTWLGSSCEFPFCLTRRLIIIEIAGLYRTVLNDSEYSVNYGCFRGGGLFQQLWMIKWAAGDELDEVMEGPSAQEDVKTGFVQILNRPFFFLFVF